MKNKQINASFSGKHNKNYLPLEHSQIIRSGVYIVWDGDRALYVGSSSHVERRIKEKSGSKGRKEAFRRRTHVEIYPCDSVRQARHLEAELIGIYRPVYNKQDIHTHSLSIGQLKAEHSKVFGEAA